MMITISVAILCSISSAGGAAMSQSLHPPVVLRDQAGQVVLESRQPVSTSVTCGACHDTDFINRHSYHAAMGMDERVEAGSLDGQRPWDYTRGGVGRWNPLTYRYLTPPGEPHFDMGVADWIRTQGWRHVGGGPALRGFGTTPLDQRTSGSEGPAVDPDLQILDPTDGQALDWNWEQSGVVEMNCFLCHIDQPANAARVAQLEAGQFVWANTATLADTGLVQQNGDRWEYESNAFHQDGSVDAEQLTLRKPTAAHCGQCHGLTHAGSEPLALKLEVQQWSTATKGQVFSAQRISDSAVNLQGKSELTRPWDVHAEAMLDCKSCHFSINNPAKFESSPRNRPAHLAFEPRRLSLGEYLRQPSHQFAKGQTAQGTIAQHLAGTMRRCEDCHDAAGTHDWLPYQAVHFDRLSCEACHISQAYAPAIGQVDWTLINQEGQPPIQWRGWKQDATGLSLVSGFQPILLPRKDLDGRTRLFPVNLISAWYWVSGESEPRPVREHDLRKAFLQEGSYRPELTAVLDQDGNGQLDDSELRLDHPDKVAVAKQLLEQVGVQFPEIVSQMQPYGLHHGVGPGGSAIRACEACHTENSRLTQSLPLAPYLPGGVVPKPVGDTDVVFAGAIERVNDSAVSWKPSLQDAGFYVLGHSHWPLVNVLGALSILGAVVGSAVHAGLRIRHGRWRLDHDHQQES